MPFLVFSNVDISFARNKLIGKSYITLETLATSRQVKVINRKEFVAAALNFDKKAFVIHVASLSLWSGVVIYPAQKVLIATLDIEKMIVSPEYSDYANGFLEAFTTELPKHIGINDYSINLVDNKQPLHGLIYSLKPVKLKTLKTYIKTNLVNGFI